jgi:hypothetical protein
MMRNKGIVLSREMIEDNLWNFDYEGGTNVVDVYVSFLRKEDRRGLRQKTHPDGLGHRLGAERGDLTMSAKFRLTAWITLMMLLMFVTATVLMVVTDKQIVTDDPDGRVVDRRLAGT